MFRAEAAERSPCGTLPCVEAVGPPASGNDAPARASDAAASCGEGAVGAPCGGVAGYVPGGAVS
ncbi:hypothetical protein ACSNOK_26830, partial [Streptomyces sp. URMC 126]|uniref:hypothetical protein n=1 Tax=Streptomyces sp. URMC 126 TaxID=3423401 RepID=UPI003F1D73F7